MLFMVDKDENAEYHISRDYFGGLIIKTWYTDFSYHCRGGLMFFPQGCCFMRRARIGRGLLFPLTIK